MPRETTRSSLTSSKVRQAASNIRTGLGVDAIAQALVDNLHCLQGRPPELATRNDWYMALAYTVRDRMMERYISTLATIAEERRDSKAVAYLSAEFLTGPQLGNGLINLGIWDAAEQAVSRFGQHMPDLLDQEEEPGLGNGGLGRLAACYMDSLATLGVPAIGYGLRYEFGIFDQVIRDGWQVEITMNRGVTACGGFRSAWFAGSRTTRQSPATAGRRPIFFVSGKRRRPSRSTSTPFTSASTTAPALRRWRKLRSGLRT